MRRAVEEVYDYCWRYCISKFKQPFVGVAKLKDMEIVFCYEDAERLGMGYIDGIPRDFIGMVIFEDKTKNMYEVDPKSTDDFRASLDRAFEED